MGGGALRLSVAAVLSKPREHGGCADQDDGAGNAEPNNDTNGGGVGVGVGVVIAVNARRGVRVRANVGAGNA